MPTVRIFVMYRPPYYDVDAEVYADILTKCITAYTVKNRSHVITGDLNLPHIIWNSYYSPSDRVNKLVLDGIIKNGYNQLVDFPTRDTNLLDIILTDDDSLITSVKSCPPVRHSDHVAIELTLTLMGVDHSVYESSCK